MEFTLAPAMCTVEELLELDLLTLREHTERAGVQFEPAQQAAQIRESLLVSRVCAVRREETLVAYAMLSPRSTSSWFVRAFNVHPSHRNASVMRSLLGQVANIARREAIAQLQSHVYKTNRLSMAFHRRLGFRITNENAVAVEFTATVAELAANKAVETDANLASFSLTPPPNDRATDRHQTAPTSP